MKNQKPVEVYCCYQEVGAYEDRCTFIGKCEFAKQGAYDNLCTKLDHQKLHCADCGHDADIMFDGIPYCGTCASFIEPRGLR